MDASEWMPRSCGSVHRSIESTVDADHVEKRRCRRRVSGRRSTTATSGPRSSRSNLTPRARGGRLLTTDYASACDMPALAPAGAATTAWRVVEAANYKATAVGTTRRTARAPAAAARRSRPARRRARPSSTTRRSCRLPGSASRASRARAAARPSTRRRPRRNAKSSS